MGSQYVLYADECGFHHGNSITRGHLTGIKPVGTALSRVPGDSASATACGSTQSSSRRTRARLEPAALEKRKWMDGW
ncbi:hypothetical protein PHLGIDRAFT_163288 [Phlebiopsis gigantea 11061_1 CR5-6]|uniref:Uncharacterized protein n=1 Tax=Phlebiopsis gigantea (strain 11061_1 CR5-6) TaxID=745531 RepID=A0A0C3S8C7_PHLG1|nr:hypothetical protein PHLGIDRAFT_163288 [Phlebiopsis gigantea 11061_1 CR5-6]